ncbi:YcaO-like family protein [Litoreibacter ponti]|nr:YcaO-like family protein [Litoreibacter ponti]
MKQEIEGTRWFASPYARNFHVCAARLKPGWKVPTYPPVYVSGKGRTRRGAEQRLLGEAVERASLLTASSQQSWTCVDPVSGNRHEIDPALYYGDDRPLSSHGTATHNIAREAKYRALLELCERRAIEDWWKGSTPTQWLPQTTCDRLNITPLVARLRGQAPLARRTRFLFLTAPPGSYVIGALGSDLSGRQLAIGFAADTNPFAALYGALEELLSVELETADLVRGQIDGDKIEPGTNRDRASRLQRRLQKFFSDTPPQDHDIDDVILPSGFARDPQFLGRGLEDGGVPVFLTDLTSPRIGVPTWRAMFRNPRHAPFRSGSDHAPL